MAEEFAVGQLYSNEEIYKQLGVSNAGGIRLRIRDGVLTRAVVMTSVLGLHGAGENPYHDRLEGGTLTYTAAGKVGEQTLSGSNQRLIEQRALDFPIHGFVLTASRRDREVGPKRWKYLGLLEYLRHYPDTQLDASGEIRKVWLFEFRIHEEQRLVPLSADMAISHDLLAASRLSRVGNPDDDEIVIGTDQQVYDVARIEQIRGSLLALEPRPFELFIRDFMVHCGFADVCATRYSADGGVDVNARAGARMWLLQDTIFQVQAKRWLHSVGRKEVAELRGSLQPYARGAVVTTSHFSKAAIHEASEEGKNPIVLVDGFRLSKAVLDEGFPLAL